jgi:hypothetical protein
MRTPNFRFHTCDFRAVTSDSGTRVALVPIGLDTAAVIAVLHECRATLAPSRPDFLAYDARRVLAHLGYDANDGEALAALEACAERFDGELEHRPEIVSEGVGRSGRVQRVGATIRPVLLWLPADFTTFREGIADLLGTVQRYVGNYERERGNPASKTEQLSPGDCERIRFAIKNRNDLDTVRDLLWGTERPRFLAINSSTRSPRPTKNSSRTR